MLFAERKKKKNRYTGLFAYVHEILLDLCQQIWKRKTSYYAETESRSLLMSVRGEHD